MHRHILTRSLKILWATHYYLEKSKDPKRIADAVNVAPSTIERWMQSDDWLAALTYWNETPPNQNGDLQKAEELWAEMVRNNDDLSAVEIPDVPFKCVDPNQPLYALIQSHLFCADNLCDEQIRARIAEERRFEGEPVRYEGQALGSLYRWWLYPNYSDGLFSKVFARANVIGDLVIGTGEDTSLVIIRYGRLTLARQVSDDVVSVFDKRLLVCL